MTDIWFDFATVTLYEYTQWALGNGPAQTEDEWGDDYEDVIVAYLDAVFA